MSQPPTLLDLVGVEVSPHAVADSTILMIDAQQELRVRAHAAARRRGRP